MWDCEVHDRVAAAVKANAEIKRMFEEDYGIQYEPIDFDDSKATFYPRKNNETEDDILDKTRQQLINEDVRELDIDLFVAVHKYSFAEVDRLLALGAEPRRWINRAADDCTSLVSIVSDLSYNKFSIIDYVLSYGSHSDECFQIGDLVDLYGWAAAEKMNTLVHKYLNARVYMNEKVAEVYDKAEDADRLYALCRNDMHYYSAREKRCCSSRVDFIAYLHNRFKQGTYKLYKAKVVDKATDGSTLVKVYKKRYGEADTFILRVMPARDNTDGLVKIKSITMEEYSPSIETDNIFSLKGMEFTDHIRKMNFKCFDDLMPLLEPLDCLSMRQGYVLDAFQCGDRIGSRLQLYCCKEGSEIMFQEPKEDEKQKKGRWPFGRAKKKELPPYTDDMYLQGMYSPAVSGLIPEIWSYITAEFLPMAAWQCYLLRSAQYIMPRNWHAIYGSRDYIFVPSDLKGLSADCSQYYDDPSVFPSVELTDDNEAVVSCCYWNDWQGLIRETVKVTFVDGHAQFVELKHTTLVPYHSSLIF